MIDDDDDSDDEDDNDNGDDNDVDYDDDDDDTVRLPNDNLKPAYQWLSLHVYLKICFVTILLT